MRRINVMAMLPGYVLMTAISPLAVGQQAPQGTQDLDRQHRRAVVFARDREGRDHQDAHQ